MYVSSVCVRNFTFVLLPRAVGRSENLRAEINRRSFERNTFVPMAAQI